ncbi:hypothetical protein SASPL_140008 [Salvia splendens]|uniref:Deacetylase sirtuin-type domain-containing protein n=1 Tax=Salvia splendens TaxID=180675 RepID=A0A8X8WP01_SALSN|nr:hypothetical protein SASPL_140008 [Salvia splendens]
MKMKRTGRGALDTDWLLCNLQIQLQTIDGFHLFSVTIIQWHLCTFPSFLKLSTWTMQKIETIRSISVNKETFWKPRMISFRGSLSFVRTYRITPTGAAMENKELPSNYLKDKMMVPNANPPGDEDVNLLSLCSSREGRNGVDSKLVVLTGAGISTESGIPDYRSPNGAYSTGFRPITHQEFMRSSRARRRYWARSYAGWRKFTTAQPGPAHIALASLEKAGRVKFMMTQNVDRLHHRAGSNPLELHGTVYVVACTNCGFSLSRSSFQDQVKALNPKVAFD